MSKLRTVFEQELLRLKREGIPISSIANDIGTPTTTLWRMLNGMTKMTTEVMLRLEEKGFVRIERGYFCEQRN